MSDLAARFAARTAGGGRPARGERVVVAVSGGLDSLVLLHLMRHAPAVPRADLVVAHFDHRMRPGSAADARWLSGLARSWDLPVEVGAASMPLATEEQARDARYAFLETVRARVGARWILTAHHADDQAETVLFRAARGAGIAGLRGIPARRGVLLRPLLPFWRRELEAYARAARITPRPDPTNVDGRFTRNALRGDVIPRLEAVVPGARRSLVRLARLAAREERAWRSLLPGLIEGVVVERSDGRVVLDRTALLAHPPAVRARVLRSLLGALGAVPDAAGTRAAMEFTRAGASGRRHPLPGGMLLLREFDRLVLASAGPQGPDPFLEIPGADSGEGWMVAGGRRRRVRWSSTDRPGDGPAETFSLPRLVFPLRFRSWRPGDRMPLSYGSKKLKKLLGEARIPLSERPRVPVLVDARDRVLWVPGIARAAGTAPAPGDAVFHIGVGP